MKKLFIFSLIFTALSFYQKPAHAYGIDSIIPKPIMDKELIPKITTQLTMLLQKMQKAKEYSETISQGIKRIGAVGASMISSFSSAAGMLVDWFGLHGVVAKEAAENYVKNITKVVKVQDHCNVLVNHEQSDALVDKVFWESFTKHTKSKKSEFNLAEEDYIWMKEVIYLIVVDEIREDIDLSSAKRINVTKRKIATIFSRIVEQWRNMRPDKIVNNLIATQNIFDNVITATSNSTNQLLEASKALEGKIEEAKTPKENQGKPSFWDLMGKKGSGGSILTGVDEGLGKLTDVASSAIERVESNEKAKKSVDDILNRVCGVNSEFFAQVTGSVKGLDLSKIFNNINLQEAIKIWENNPGLANLIKNDDLKALLNNQSLMLLLKNQPAILGGLKSALENHKEKKLVLAQCPKPLNKDCSDGSVSCNEAEKKCYEIIKKSDEDFIKLEAKLAELVANEAQHELKNLAVSKPVKLVQSISSAMGNVACVFGNNCANDMYKKLLNQADNSTDLRADLALNSTMLLQLYRQLQRTKHITLSRITMQTTDYIGGDMDTAKVAKTLTSTSKDEKIEWKKKFNNQQANAI